MIDGARWQRIEPIFHEVVDLPDGTARDAAVRHLCGHDDALATDLRALLDEDQRLRHEDPLEDPYVGTRLGRYIVDTLVARGGMAAVYEAHRADDEFQQRVALKIMDIRLSDPTMVARFKTERQILAELEHPALTRLLDGGVTGLGAPYLVMEFVEGQPIDRYCDARRLDVPARLRLFQDVCEGVAFAHRNLVLHRDLKPSNILVTANGHVKVVDFGTATLLQPERMATVSRAPMTPAYASPEQLTGQATGTASDQYSLGLVLYELVTGEVPFADRTSLMASIERALTHAEPPAPHAAVTAEAAHARHTSMARLRRQLAGDLGTIVRKSIAGDPDARYASVQHLAEDLERWRSGDAIVGRAPSLVYRATRLVRRHWVAVSVAAALIVSLLAATVVSMQQVSIARRESSKAQRLNGFLTAMLSSANPTWRATAVGDGSLSMRQVLDGAGQLIATELAQTPEAEADIRRTLGQTYLGLGSFEQATPHLNHALALYQGLGDEFGMARTQALLGLGAVQRGDTAEAETQLRQALAYIRRAGDGIDPLFLFSVTNDLGGAIAHGRPGDPEAQVLLREAIAVEARHRLSVAGASVALLHLGIELLQTGQIDEAAVALVDAARRMDTLDPPPPERSSVLRTLSTLELQRGNYAEAERLAAASVAQGARTRPADHPLQASYKLAWGRALIATGRLEQGRGALLEALDAYRRIRPAGHLELAGPLLGLGIVYRLEGRLQDSERALREAQVIIRQNPGAAGGTAELEGELGLTLRALGRTTEADAHLRESHQAYLAAFGAAHPSTRRAQARVQAAE